MLRRQNVWVIAWVLLAAASHAWANEQIQWAPNLSAAITQASRQNQLVLIHFWTPDCAPCRQLEKNVFSRPEVAAAIHRDFVPVKINAQALPDTARKYNVDRWPTDVIITPAGYVLHTMVSPQDPREYTTALVRVAGQRRPGAQVAANAPGAGPGGQPAPWGSEYAWQDAPAAGAWDGDNWNRSSPTSRGQSAWNEPQAQPPWGQQGTGHTASYGSQYADQSGPPAGDPRYNPQPQSSVNPYLAPGAAPGGQPSAPAASASSTRPTLGLDGYCPVTMVDQGKWQRGDERYGIIHRGRLYLFAGDAEKQRFWADPDRFAPMLSGNDPVEFVENGRLVPGHRRHGVFYRNQIYLFVSEESLQTFWNSPQRYADASQQAMRRVQAREMR